MLAMLGKSSEALGYLHKATTIFEKAATVDRRHKAVNYDLVVAYVWIAPLLGNASDSTGALHE
jgi:hypothetical protein